jgi:hypothetical protein
MGFNMSKTALVVSTRSVIVTTSNSKGLVDRLRAAANSKQVNELLAEGKKYRDASEKTRRRWKAVAERRLKELNGSK